MSISNVPTFANISLYVGDLDPETTEAQLVEKFSTCGTVTLARLCRDKITRQSLGYAYVNFSQPNEAEVALDTLNFELINGRPMRIMWSQRDPALRKSGVGNVFIKNLDKNIDNKSLYDTFASFGTIISCKIMSDQNGSKGYGFVHFDTQEAAERAIKNVNNMALNGKIVYVGNFLSKHDRSTNEDETAVFTNVYVKNFQDLLEEKSLSDLFAKFGEITSVKIARDENNKPIGYGYVNFKNPEDALKAVKEMNDYELNEKKLYVGRFQKKSERLNELKKKYEQRKLEKQSKYSGVNLFIKNLDDKIDDERLKKEFSIFGEITSAKVMSINGRSKGFGFVCYKNPEDATKASNDMNGRMLLTKPLYIAVAQRKEERSKMLIAQFKEKLLRNAYYNQQTQNMYYPYSSNALANQSNNQRFVPLDEYQPLMNNQYMRINTSVPRWQNPNNYQRINTAQNQNASDNIFSAYMPSQFNQNSGVQRNLRPQLNNYMNQQKYINQSAFNNPTMNYQNRFANQQTFNQIPNNIRNPSPRYKQASQQMMPAQQLVTHVPGQEPLTIAELSSADPKQQKQMLGERLYPLIQNINPGLAGKVTGMLLEIDNAELLHMLESPESLKAKVDEALAVLQNHRDKQAQQQ